MPDYFVIDFQTPNNFDLEQWAKATNLHAMTLVLFNTVWELRNDQAMLLGTAFQIGNKIYLSWECLSFGPRLCWLATQLVGELLNKNCTLTVGPCPQEQFTGAQATLGNVTI